MDVQWVTQLGLVENDLRRLALAQNFEPRWWSSEDCAASAAGRSEIFLDLVLLKGTP